MALVWASLALAVVLPSIGIVVLVRHGLALWRDLRRGSRALFAALDSLGPRLQQASAATAGLEAATARPAPSLAQLQVSLARLAVLRSALQDVQDAAGRVSAIYPRK